MKRIHTYSHGGKKAWKEITLRAKDAPVETTRARMRYDGVTLWWRLMHEGMKSRMALSVVRATSMVMRCHSGTRGEIDIATKE